MKTRSKAPRPREAEIQKTAMALLRSLGWRVYRRNVMAMAGEHKGKRWFVRAGEPGMSDLWGVIPPSILTPAARATWGRYGRHFEAECKRPNERPTLSQVQWLIQMNEMTGAAFWFDSLDILDRVARCLMAGGRVEYLATERKYGHAYGPSGDYDIVWADNF